MLDFADLFLFWLFCSSFVLIVPSCVLFILVTSKKEKKKKATNKFVYFFIFCFLTVLIEQSEISLVFLYFPINTSKNKKKTKCRLNFYFDFFFLILDGILLCFIVFTINNLWTGYKSFNIIVDHRLENLRDSGIFVEITVFFPCSTPLKNLLHACFSTFCWMGKLFLNRWKIKHMIIFSDSVPKKKFASILPTSN